MRRERMSGELCGLVSPVSRMRQVEDATMRAKRVMTANLTRTKTEGNRYPVEALDQAANTLRTCTADPSPIPKSSGFHWFQQRFCAFT